MPIPPPPCTYRCPACGWSKTVQPASDALIRGVDYFDRCPRCDAQPLERHRAEKSGFDWKNVFRF
ncbi:hypothetical protein EBQ25_08795 [Allofranklinella schreckenbergeri]|uniref:Uncharacterized protein n=1 Tax=Allofranklinella schreckenbergeri TaxID=1076744 RepID=A0A3M6Q6Q9_9BURK|nr:hypothetical protein [Allofranklinella schreckenbergeri]RMW98656.1 hypothetical protein EBQ25_08795 [Allofranklinella schreckenbergeri]